MTETTTVVVTIGRNVGDDPMDLDSWNQFVWSTRARVSDVATLWTVATYRGEWDGVSEDAVIFFGQLTNGDRDVDQLRQNLATLATYYRQESIGLAVGTSELVSSYGVDAVVAEQPTQEAAA